MAIPLAAPTDPLSGKEGPCPARADAAGGRVEAVRAEAGGLGERAGRAEAASPAALGSFEEVYEEHFDFVWRTVRRLGVHEASVEDAVQDVFVVVHRRGGEFEGRSSVKTWLFGIVVHVARAYRRRRAPEPSADLDHVVDAASHTPHTRAEAAEARRLLYEVLETLDDDKREVFVLVELEETTAPEAAETLGLNLNTVYSRLRAARRDFDAEVARRAARDGWRLS